MYNRMGQIVTKIGNVRKKKQFVVKLFYPKIVKEAIKKKFTLNKWLVNLHGFANICKHPIVQTLKVMQSKICKKGVFHKYF